MGSKSLYRFDEVGNVQLAMGKYGLVHQWKEIRMEETEW
jgi:hypothetical protein